MWRAASSAATRQVEPPPSCVRRAARNHSRVRHPAAEFADLLGLSPGPDDHALSRLSTMCWATAVFGESRRSSCPVSVRLSRCRAADSSPTIPALHCNWRTSGRTWRWTTRRAESICRWKISRSIGVSESDIAERRADAAISRDDEVRSRHVRANGFSMGLPLAKMVDSTLALDIELFSRGGLEILERHRTAATTTC